MERGNDQNLNAQNSFGLNPGNSNLEQGFNSFNSQNNMEIPNGQLNHDLNNQILPSLQPNPVYLNNLNENISEIDKEEEDQNKNEETSNNKGDESDNKKSPKINKRRSKSEIEGRTFECKLCNKRYLSYPALYTHCKQKHKTNNSSGRGRGRPKKEGAEIETEKNKYNPINSSYFSKEERTGKTEPSEINNCIDMAFSDLYSIEYKTRNEQREMKFYTHIEEHPFLYKFKNDIHNLNENITNEHECTDNILINYLNKMSNFCNKNYYIRLIKFVTLFREHVNIVNKTKVLDNTGIEREFTEVNDAEDVPDSSNEFITDFLSPDDKNEDFGFSKEESIDLTQNLCFWMYDNNFTCSKLSLISSEK